MKSDWFAVAVTKEGGVKVKKSGNPWECEVYLWVRVGTNRYVSQVNVSGSDRANPCLFLYRIVLLHVFFYVFLHNSLK
jgi:hypothetical protein